MDPLPSKTLGQRLRELRMTADLSLRDLGDRLKDPVTNTPVSAAFLSDIENGRRFPSDEMIEKLAEILGADPMELRRCDPRAPTREIQDLATMNPKYAFAFRRAVEYVQDWKITPEEFIRLVESGELIVNPKPVLPDFASAPTTPDDTLTSRRRCLEADYDSPPPPSPPANPTSHDPQT